VANRIGRARRNPPSALGPALTASLATAAPFVAPAAHAQPSGPGWSLVWSDEFTATFPDPSNWLLINQAWPYNQELEYYSPLAVSISNGKLVITSTNQPRGGRLYTSGRVESRDRRFFRFGRFEMRAKLPGTQGIWPAFWLLPQAGQWPPEIDIMELLGHQPTITYGTNHWPDGGGGSIYQTSSLTGPNFTTSTNNFACEWFPDRIDFFINGQLYATHRSAIPQEDMYIILNTAVGGLWPGNPNASTVFPQTFEVEWVRVWQRVGDVILNPGMEWSNATTAIDKWNKWGNVFWETNLVRSGRSACKMYGNFNVPNNTSGLYQDLPASPGQEFEARAFAQTPSWDRMSGSNAAFLNIEWRDASNNLISFISTQVLSAASAPNVWREGVTRGIAPPSAAKARVVLLHQQGPSLAGGAVWWDDIAFARTSLPCDDLDFNADGIFPDNQDIVDFINVFAGGACPSLFCGDADFNNDGIFPDNDDVAAFIQAFAGAGC
jgi:beta-glucanase (GH16 family)